MKPANQPAPLDLFKQVKYAITHRPWVIVGAVALMGMKMFILSPSSGPDESFEKNDLPLLLNSIQSSINMHGTPFNREADVDVGFHPENYSATVKRVSENPVCPSYQIVIKRKGVFRDTILENFFWRPCYRDEAPASAYAPRPGIPLPPGPVRERVGTPQNQGNYWVPSR